MSETRDIEYLTIKIYRTKNKYFRRWAGVMDAHYTFEGNLPLVVCLAMSSGTLGYVRHSLIMKADRYKNREAIEVESEPKYEVRVEV